MSFQSMDFQQRLITDNTALAKRHIAESVQNLGESPRMHDLSNEQLTRVIAVQAMQIDAMMGYIGRLQADVASLKRTGKE